MILFALLPLILLAITVANFILIRTPRDSSAISQTVGVIVPMRNESENVAEVIDCLSAQQANAHFYLLDDNSEDDTLELLHRYSKDDSRFTVISGAPLPNNWIGKCWALQQLFESTDEQILVSLDADVRISKDAIIKAINTLNSAQLDFISPYPRQIALTSGERLIQPLLQWSWLTTVPLRIAERSKRSSLAVANGQFFVVRRSALEKIGGYQSVKQAVLDDVFLARELIHSGSRGVVINGSDIAHTRMYSSWGAIKAGYGKSLSKAFGSKFGAFFVICFLLFSSVAPLMLALLGNIYGLIGFVAITLTRMLSAQRSRSRLIDSVLHPISVLMLIYLILYSYLARGSITWKGRAV